MLNHNGISDCWKNFNNGKVKIYPNTSTQTLLTLSEVLYNWLEFVSRSMVNARNPIKLSCCML
jgi:hypothetical protein